MVITAVVREDMELVWEMLLDDTRRNRVLVFNRHSASSIEGLRLAPFGAFVNDYFFDVQAARGEKGG